MPLWDSCSNLSGDNVRGYGIKFKSSMVTNIYRHHPAQDKPDALLWGLPFHGHFPLSRFKRDLSAWTSPALARLWKPQSLTYHTGTCSSGHGTALDEKMRDQGAQLSHTVGLFDIFLLWLLLWSCYLRFEAHRHERWGLELLRTGHVLENSSTR